VETDKVLVVFSTAYFHHRADLGAGFPTDHPLSLPVRPSRRASGPDAAGAFATPSVILILYWVDLAGPSRMAYSQTASPGQCHRGEQRLRFHNGWD